MTNRGTSVKCFSKTTLFPFVSSKNNTSRSTEMSFPLPLRADPTSSV
uniref:Uncharacterized protein n=1 Tax=Anguilla anguilla TaxID=7936 RepID=A0A0E9TN80_ANGAN